MLLLKTVFATHWWPHERGPGVVVTLSLIMYKNTEVSNTDIALYTSWLYLPWVIKPLWAPLIELFGTKQSWIVALRCAVGVALTCVALTIPEPDYFRMTLATFWLMSFASASRDIAADRFYMLVLLQNSQAAFVGVRSTFYRLGEIVLGFLLLHRFAEAQLLKQATLLLLDSWNSADWGYRPKRLKLSMEPLA